MFFNDMTTFCHHFTRVESFLKVYIYFIVELVGNELRIEPGYMEERMRCNILIIADFHSVVYLHAYVLYCVCRDYACVDGNDG